MDEKRPNEQTRRRERIIPVMIISKALEQAHDLIRKYSDHWVIFGAVAANLYRSEPRTTFDIDILLTTTKDGLKKIEHEALEQGWQIKGAEGADWLLRLVHEDFGAIDLILVEDEYQKQAMARSREVNIGGRMMRALQPEDIVIHKLISHRAQDDADIIAILESEPPLDWQYIQKWVEHWDLQSNLEFIERRYQEMYDEPVPKQRMNLKARAEE